MHIHLGSEEGHLQSIELDRVNHHRALAHLNKFISFKKPEHFKTIHKIHIEHSILNNDDFFALENIIAHCTELFEVELDSNHIDMKNAQDLLCALSVNHLKSLSFTDNWIGEKISEDFFEFMKTQNQMKSLDFSLNWLRDKGIVKLIESISSDLEQLQLSCNDFHSDGMMAICNFVVNSPNLRELDISYNRLDCKSAEHIAKVIKENNRHISIKANSNQLGDGGAAIIADALVQKAKPINLDLSDNEISFLGAKCLIDGVSVDGVKSHIDLRNNFLNKDELSHIIRAKQEQYPLFEVLY